jgi:uncharacterized YccA/Bax inhibitor family protein
MASNNPVVRENTFAWGRELAGTQSMTVAGAINKTGILLLILVATSIFAWNAESSMLGMIGAFGGFGCAIWLSRNPAKAPVLAPIYAGLEGLMVGTFSVFMEAAYPGIPGNAVAMTFAVLGVMLICYRVGLLRATPMFTRVVMFGTMAVMVVYLIDFVLGFFHMPIPMIHEGKPIGIVFSLIVIGLAAMNLILDFDMFERNATRSPKYMEWYCGFALIVTLVWLYLEMVRLLSKLNRR